MIDPQLTPLELALLQDARVPQDIGTGYGTVRHLDQDLSQSEQHSMLAKALLGLARGGFLGFFRAPLDDGYSLSLDEVTALDLKEVIAELALGPEHTDEVDDVLFFVATEAGLKIVSDASR
jgi:hypothetical protein